MSLEFQEVIEEEPIKLSVLVPSIRPQNLQRLYNSVAEAFTGKFEFLVIGPYGLPDSLNNTHNVLWLEDWGSPLRAQQIGLIQSNGEYITWAADDGYYLPNSLDRAFELLEGKDYKAIIMGKYQEGERKDDHMEGDAYYILNNHVQSSCFFIPENTWMLNCGVVSRRLLIELGGWDSFSFHTCPQGYNDFSIRAQQYGCQFIIQQQMMFECSHMPGTTGDHAPIHNVQTQRDEPMFKEIWNHPYFSKRLAIDLNNWKKSPARWKSRFGE